MSLVKQNLIYEEDMKDHSVKKYEFREMSFSESKPAEQKDTTEPLKQEEVKTTMPINAIAGPLEKELIDRLLQKSDELSGNLAKLEIQFEKSQEQAKENLDKISQDSYQRGLQEGRELAKNELENSINEERKKIIDSYITLENTLKASQAHLEALEKELSTIAIDMAREVIIKEIDTNSQKVALELTKSLLQNIMDATDIYIRVNPIDYVYLKENLKDLEKINLEADNAISRGGVVIASSLGSLDGNIMSRYKALKQSVLDTMM